MMKKRTISIALALVLLLLTTIPAFAAPITTHEGSGTAVLSYAVKSTFSVIIPEAVTVGEDQSIVDSVLGTGTITVSSGMLLAYGKELNVKISGANFDSTDHYRLKDGSNENYLKYSIFKGEGEGKTQITENNVEVLTIAAGTTEGGAAALTYKLAQAATIAGTYTDTLTFTVTID